MPLRFLAYACWGWQGIFAFAVNYKYL